MQLQADPYGRRFRKLRVSLTSACNFACVYCVPDGERLLPTDSLDAAQLLAGVGLLARVVPLESLRITGGEPLIAPALDGFLAGLPELAIDDVSLTTNGYLLRRRLDQLLAAGIRRLNISIDSMDPAGFEQMTRGGRLSDVLSGIDACVEAGVELKLNMVPMRGLNDSQVLPLLDFALERGAELRYIELMRMGHLRREASFEQLVYPMADILAQIQKHHAIEELDVPRDSTSRRWQIAGQGTFGIIPNVSSPFCAGCNRLRLMSGGALYGCLSNARSHDLKPLLDLPEKEAIPQLAHLLGLAMSDKQPVRFEGMIASMRSLGG